MSEIIHELTENENMIPSSVKSILADIRDEKNGFIIGKPWRWDATALGIVVPITNSKAKERNYVTNHEVDKKNIKIGDTGKIERLKIEVDNDKPVFFRTGTIFSGNTQERGLQKSVVVGKEDNESSSRAYGERPLHFRDSFVASVRCVHASKGISSGTKMESTSFFAPRDVSNNLMDDVSDGPQRRVWQSIQGLGRIKGLTSNRSRSRGSQSHFFGGPLSSGRSGSSARVQTCEYRANSCFEPSSIKGESYSSLSSLNAVHEMKYEEDSLSGLAGLFGGTNTTASDDLLGMVSTDKMDEMMRKVPYTNDQVGAFLFDMKGILGFEMFDSTASWKAIKNAIIAQYGNDISDKEADIPFTIDDAQSENSS